MREIWAKIIGYDGEVVIHWQYSNSKKKLVHYLKYILRSYVQKTNYIYKITNSLRFQKKLVN